MQTFQVRHHLVKQRCVAPCTATELPASHLCSRCGLQVHGVGNIARDWCAYAIISKRTEMCLDRKFVTCEA